MNRCALVVVLSVICFSFGRFSPSAEANRPIKDISNQLQLISIEKGQPINFCGYVVPTHRKEVRHKLNRAIEPYLVSHSFTRKLRSRVAHYKKIVLPILRKHKIPEDFFYLGMAESGLDNLTSPKGAKGYWQFMETAATRYGLEVSESVDERMHLRKSTEAACKYLLDSYDHYRSWPLVAASYNMGTTGLNKALEREGTRDYFQLNINAETGNYLYRILAIKYVFEQPLRYGLKEGRLKPYFQPLARYVKVANHIEDLEAFAISEGTDLASIQELNPWLVGENLMVTPGKKYEIKLPFEKIKGTDESLLVSTPE